MATVGTVPGGGMVTATVTTPGMVTGTELLIPPTVPVLAAVEEFLEEVSTDSEAHNEIVTIIKDSHLDQHFSSKWKPAKIQLITNANLQSDYEEKRQDFLIRGRKEEELRERWGFCVENNTATLELVCSIGFQGRDSDYNALGYNRMGVYCCKNSDVCLQHALIKHSGASVMRMVICKYVAGRPTKAIPRVASASEFIEPTQGFDCHESVIPPQPFDSLQNQFDRSQVYIYEINKLLQPSQHPRQLLPYALVSYTQDGLYVPAIDAEATTAEKLSTNPRLQQIIHQINTKDSDSPSPSGSSSSAPATVATSSGGGVLLAPLASPGLSASSTPPLTTSDLQMNGLEVTTGDSNKYVSLTPGGGADNLLQRANFLPPAAAAAPTAGNQTFLQAMAAAGLTGQNGLLPSPPCAAAAAPLPFTAFSKAITTSTGLLGLRNSHRPLTPEVSATTYLRQSANPAAAMFGYNTLPQQQQTGMMIPYSLAPAPAPNPPPGLGAIPTAPGMGGYGKLFYPTAPAATTPVFSTGCAVTYPGLFPGMTAGAPMFSAPAASSFPQAGGGAGTYLGAPGLMFATAAASPATLKRALATDPYGLTVDKRAKYC